MKFKPDVTFFRHGKTLYTEQPRDLTPEGVAQVTTSAEALARQLTPDQPVVVFSSPRSRGLYTAQLVVGVLAKHGFNVSEADIEVTADLDEVHGFSWDPLLRSLVSGGIAKFGEVTYDIDPKHTNPAGVSVGKYFNGDFAHKLPKQLRKKLPAGYLAHVDAMESFSSVVDRFLRLLSYLYTAYAGTATHVVLAGHDASAGFPAEVFSGGKLTGIQPGESIDLMFEGGQVFVTRVGALHEGRSNWDLFTEYHQFF